MATTNLTLKLDSRLVREARVLAAHAGTSISRLVSQKIEEMVRDRGAYESAKKTALARLGAARNLGWKRAKSRAELHER